MYLQRSNLDAFLRHSNRYNTGSQTNVENLGKVQSMQLQFRRGWVAVIGQRFFAYTKGAGSLKFAQQNGTACSVIFVEDAAT